MIVVAYIGRDGPSFFEQPNGIEMYCWPQAGGTHPAAIEELRHRARVHFAVGIHTRLYWTEGVGGLVTSANLSASAVSEGIRREFGVFVENMGRDYC